MIAWIVHLARIVLTLVLWSPARRVLLDSTACWALKPGRPSAVSTVTCARLAITVLWALQHHFPVQQARSAQALGWFHWTSASIAFLDHTAASLAQQHQQGHALLVRDSRV